MNQTGLSSSDTPGEESAESPHDGAAPTSPAMDSAHPPRAAPDMTDAPDEENEKDAQDHLTPAAMVHAASGIQLQRVVRNANDLEKGDDDPEKDVEQVDKVLASMPPTLERQPAVPSQPGAFRAGGARNDDESVLSGTSSVPPTAPGLIEATLVEEGAPPPPPAVVAPVYKGQIVEEADDDTTTAELPENVVTLPKRYVRCFVVAFIILCIITIVSVLLVIFLPKNDGDGLDESSSPDVVPANGPYWYHDKSPNDVWATLKGYKYVSHHMAVVSISNPNITSLSIVNAQGTYGPAMCTHINDQAAWTMSNNQSSAQLSNHRRFLRDQRGRNHGSDSNAKVMVTFTCGGNQAAPMTTIVKGRPETMILFHDADVNYALGLDSEFITCKDVKISNDGPYKYNAVFCQIPSDRSDSFPFLFSCFSQTEEMAAVASVETHNLAVQCSVTQNNTEVEDDDTGKPPEIFVDVITPAAVVLSTQRFCLDLESDDFVLQNNLLNGRNLTDACSEDGMRLDVADVPLCLSETLSANASDKMSQQQSGCPNGAEVCFGTNFTLPNVTVYDPWNADGEASEACALSHSVDDSLVVKNPEDNYPSVPLINSSTLQQMRIYLDAQKGWVQDKVLNTSNT
jgi:hypothetical protein